MVIGACLWIRRTDWRQLGGFPEWLGSIGEDLYLCCAARLAGIPVLALNSSGYRHRQGETFGGNKPQEGRLVSTIRRRALSERNKTFALIVMTPTPIMWPLLALHLASLAVEGVVVSAIKRKSCLWRDVYWNVFLELRNSKYNVFAMRRALQGSRVLSIRRYLQGFTLAPRKLVMLMKYGFPDIRH